jgi:hypothetical protein
MPDYNEPPETETLPPHDKATGEVIEATAERVQEPPQESRALGRAADGNVIPPPANSVGALLDQLEDGQLSYELTQELQELAAKIRDVAQANGGKAKGELTLKLNLSLEGDAFHIGSSFKMKAPELPRRRSIMWQDESGNFSRFPPRQTQMFGIRAPVRVVG